jgi:hypothetical protein
LGQEQDGKQSQASAEEGSGAKVKFYRVPKSNR